MCARRHLILIAFLIFCSACSDSDPEPTPDDDSTATPQPTCGPSTGGCDEDTATPANTPESSPTPACEPADEVCGDGVDNDCDGSADEGCVCSPGEMRECGLESGACLAGQQTCGDDGQWGECLAAVYPADETCDGVDNDCDGAIDEDLGTTWYRDDDGDGFGDSSQSQLACEPPPGSVAESGDCNDADAAVHPDAEEVCEASGTDSIDNDCDGAIDETCDCSPGEVRECGAENGACTPGEQSCETDGHWGECVAAVYPADETCDGADNDCDGQIDEDVTTLSYLDADGDGYGDSSQTQQSCGVPSGYAAEPGDCNDSDADIHPGTDDLCNGVDDDCDGTADEDATAVTWYPDEDGDGYGTSSGSVESCAELEGYALVDGDCEDSQASIHPGADEVCNALDDDCGGDVDEGLEATWYPDQDGDGHGSATGEPIQDCAQPEGYSATATDCDDGDGDVNPGAEELCNGLDDDCEGGIDEGVTTTWYADQDADGYGAATDPGHAGCEAPDGAYVANNLDCDDQNAALNPAQAETCDGIDNNCNAVIDDGENTWYADVDEDSFGDPAGATLSCEQPEGFVPRGDDCDDTDASITFAPYWYADRDGDGYGTPDADALVTACAQPDGYVGNDMDCDDGDASIHPGPDSAQRCFPLTTVARTFTPLNYCDAVANGGPWCIDEDGSSGPDQAGNPIDPLTYGRLSYQPATGELWYYRTLADGDGTPPHLEDYQAVWSGAMSLMTFAHIADTHIDDSFSPAHLGEWDQLIDSALHMADSYTCMSLEAMVRTINRFHDIHPFQFTIATGDLANNGQHNELSWFLGLMAGGTEIQCTSGDAVGIDVIPGTFDRFDAFVPEGLSMPWIVTPGNHDRSYNGLGVSMEAPQGALTEYLENILLVAFGGDADDAYLFRHVGEKFNDDVDGYVGVSSFWYYPEDEWIDHCLTGNPVTEEPLCDPAYDMRSQWAMGILGNTDEGGTLSSYPAVRYPNVDLEFCGYGVEACYPFNVYMDYYDYPTREMDDSVFTADVNGDGIGGDIEGPVDIDRDRQMATSAEWMAAFVNDCPPGEDGCHGLTEQNITDLNIVNEDPDACRSGPLTDQELEDIECEYSGEYVYRLGDLPIRIIAIDTNSRLMLEALSDGQVRRPTMEWVKRQIAAAQDEGDLVILTSHHPTTSFISSSVESSSTDSLAGSPFEYITYDEADPETGTQEINEFVQELLQPYTHAVDGELHIHDLYKAVILHATGHQHKNRVDARPAKGADFDGNGTVNEYEAIDCNGDGDEDEEDWKCGWWEVAAPSLVDSPLMMRFVELAVFPEDPTRLQLIVTSVDYEIPENADPAMAKEMLEARRLALLDGAPNSVYRGVFGGGGEIERNVVLEVRIPETNGQALLEYAAAHGGSPVISQQFALPDATSI